MFPLKQPDRHNQRIPLLGILDLMISTIHPFNRMSHNSGSNHIQINISTVFYPYQISIGILFCGIYWLFTPLNLFFLCLTTKVYLMQSGNALFHLLTHMGVPFSKDLSTNAKYFFHDPHILFHLLLLQVFLQ